MGRALSALDPLPSLLFPLAFSLAFLASWRRIFLIVSAFPPGYSPIKRMACNGLQASVDNSKAASKKSSSKPRTDRIFPLVVGHESDRRKRKRLLIRSPVPGSKPCEASNGGHGGAGGQRQGHPTPKGAKTPHGQSGLLSPPVARRTAGRETPDIRRVGPSDEESSGNGR